MEPLGLTSPEAITVFYVWTADCTLADGHVFERLVRDSPPKDKKSQLGTFASKLELNQQHV